MRPRLKWVIGVAFILLNIDLGEASSIQLAEQHRNSLLIIDDKAGRLEAHARGLHYIGLPGLVIQAKRMGKIVAARSLVLTLTAAGWLLYDRCADQSASSAGGGSIINSL